MWPGTTSPVPRLQATGGQILASSLLKELTDSGGDIEFDGGTEVELKGLTGTQRVFAIGW